MNLTAGPITREWCDDCNTSAVLRFGMFEMTADGVRLAGHWRACTRCEPGLVQ